jgi:carbamoyl-phosphate synthase small subunit
MKNIATLVLEDGTIYTGEAFGKETNAVFELVFNTSMTGYQEILTDPSYRGQGVLFTVSHLGNTGINPEDNESQKAQVSAVVTRSLSPLVSNWRATLPLSDWLTSQGVPGISGVDTRALTRKLRDGGTQKAALSTCGTPAKELLRQVHSWPGLDGRDMVAEVTCQAPYLWSGEDGSAWVAEKSDTTDQPFSIAVYDFGVKRNILRHLAGFGAQVTVYPAYPPAHDVLASHPDGVFLSNGPGDPAGLPALVQSTRELLQSGLPVFGICLGHQLIGRALGADTRRLKFGHHGGNHPVQHLASGKTLITAQNHNYFVVPEDLDLQRVEITYRSLNDGSLEGLRLKNAPVFSVQFHPEAAPGPHDGHDIFTEFIDMIQTGRKNAQTL